MIKKRETCKQKNTTTTKFTCDDALESVLEALVGPGRSSDGGGGPSWTGHHQDSRSGVDWHADWIGWTLWFGDEGFQMRKWRAGWVKGDNVCEVNTTVQQIVNGVLCQSVR